MKKRNLTLLAIISIIILISCSDEKNQETFDLNGKYTHSIIGCENLGNPEINCIEFIEFIDDSNVIVLIGGGDVIFQTKYILNDHQIELEQIGGLNFDISFNIQNISTLKRIQDDGIWLKSE